uniref:Reverse transcriptase domain-containing protein n=1 Tax=Ascaris lumbricoides TaxID=6252 RepID=A0A0M3IKB5_ASCLU
MKDGTEVGGKKGIRGICPARISKQLVKSFRQKIFKCQYCAIPRQNHDGINK